MPRNTNVAVFIDAENVGAGNAKQIFDEASNYGDIIVKRIFADWSKAALKNWREEINRYSITAEQQFGIVSKKNCATSRSSFRPWSCSSKRISTFSVL